MTYQKLMNRIKLLLFLLCFCMVNVFPLGSQLTNAQGVKQQKTIDARDDKTQSSDPILGKIAQARTLTYYPNADGVWLIDESKVDLRNDGTYIKKDHKAFEILTDKGKHDISTINLGYSRTYHTLNIEYARVIKLDGRIVQVEPEDIKDITFTWLTLMNIYDEDVRQKVITFKNLEIGDVVDYQVVYDCFHPPMKGAFSDGAIFESFYPIVSKRYTIMFPSDVLIKHVIRNGYLDFSEKTDTNTTTYQWQAENVGRVYREWAAPSLWDTETTLMISTIKNWEDVSQWYHQLSRSRMTLDDALKNEVKRLTNHLNSEDEKIWAIYNFVSQKIRYMGLGTGIDKGFEPKPVTETYYTKYGVCRDIAALMVSMLNEANIPANIALTGVGYEVEKSIPSISFNHAIVAIKDQNGKYIYADPTAEDSRELLFFYEHDQDVLVCTEEGETLDRTPVSPAEQNTGYMTIHSELDVEGNLRGTYTLNTKGIYDYAIRSMIKRSSPKQIKDEVQKTLQDIHPNSKLSNFKTSDMSNLKDPAVITFDFKITDYTLKAGPFLLVRPPLATGKFDIITNSILKMTRTIRRWRPWKGLGSTYGVHEEETMAFPEGYRILSIPDSQEITYDSLRYSLVYSHRDKESNREKPNVHFARKLMIDKKQLTGGEYYRLQDVLKARARSAKGEVIFITQPEKQ
ncbi:DUF3857 domain-containing transglutaminase family protein [Thermodesulfobacteriota bacterium]